ncbi:Npun_F5749 family FMN-dependent PPOX-type flavoprotein [Leptolyngbya sp. PCC 6406]|uniref:Npun_F5749 family FMN-dependent PPOX-type flavoprotein n=1 Tax=Leptolyngbya sp. PCC 6406 TaxID=1173264 RepID=UPI0002ACCA86|nr:FMN-dependent protein [Leptolyngbya sp. PCC 6406]
MTLAPWRSPLARALHRNRSRPYSRYLQLATLRADGRPANRTVVFRGFLPESDRLIFVTDTRSNKVVSLGDAPAAEACWYFTQTREQFRLGGTLTLVTAATVEETLQVARHHAWQALSDNARQQFTWPHPGQPHIADGFDTPHPDPTAPLDGFALLLLNPDQVDHLELRGSPQNRWIYLRQENSLVDVMVRDQPKGVIAAPSWRAIVVNP